MKNLTIPISEEEIVSLHVGDAVQISGIATTGRDAAHKYMVGTLIEGSAPLSPEDQKLYDELRSILKEGAIEFGVKNRAVFKAQDEKYNVELGSMGMKVNEADTVAFQKASQAVYDEYRGKCGDAFIDELIETVKKTN